MAGPNRRQPARRSLPEFQTTGRSREYEYDFVTTRQEKEETFWGEAVVYSSIAGFDSALIIKTSETAAVTRQKASQR